MQPSILSLETAVPQYSQDQTEVADKMAAFLDLPPERAALLKRIFKGTCIEKRHTAIEDYVRNPMCGDFLGDSSASSALGMSRRNEAYKQHALPLSLQSAEQALEAWGGPRESITHVVYVSCTGLVAPGIEFHLMNALGLNKSVQRFALNFMGCFGAFKGLAMARSFANEHPDHRILLVCTELCSLHFDLSGEPESFVPMAIFADGSAAAVVGQDPSDGETPLFTIEKTASIALEDSLEDMSWEATDRGLRMALSPKVPEKVKGRARSFAETLIGSERRIADCDWALHPGGKAILNVIEERCGLSKDQTAPSWKVLKHYGNMSSSTFLFVLHEQLQRPTHRLWSVGIGFGPGLSMEGLVLERRAP
jgi:predicted naringenin-chalcone synthase